MMRVLTILILIVVSTTAVFGQKCRYSKNVIDEFTGEKIKISKTIEISNYPVSFKVTMKFKQVDDNYFVSLIFATSNKLKNYALETDNITFWKAGNDEMIKLVPTERVKAQYDYSYNSTGAVTVTSFDVTYPISEESLRLISAHGLTKVRFDMGSNFEAKVGKLKNRRLKMLTDCIMNREVN